MSKLHLCIGLYECVGTQGAATNNTPTGCRDSAWTFILWGVKWPVVIITDQHCLLSAARNRWLHAACPHYWSACSSVNLGHLAIKCLTIDPWQSGPRKKCPTKGSCQWLKWCKIRICLASSVIVWGDGEADPVVSYAGLAISLSLGIWCYGRGDG